jgi:hypothetical protein
MPLQTPAPAEVQAVLPCCAEHVPWTVVTDARDETMAAAMDAACACSFRCGRP